MEWTLGGGEGGGRREREDKLREEGAVKSEKVEKEYASRVVTQIDK